jgi:hypothetical protein
MITLNSKDIQTLSKVKAKGEWKDLSEVGFINNIVKSLGINNEKIGLKCASHIKQISKKGNTSMKEILKGCPSLRPKKRVSKEKRYVKNYFRGRGGRDDGSKHRNIQPAKTNTERIIEAIAAQNRASAQAAAQFKIGQTQELLIKQNPIISPPQINKDYPRPPQIKQYKPLLPPQKELTEDQKKQLGVIKWGHPDLDDDTIPTARKQELKSIDGHRNARVDSYLRGLGPQYDMRMYNKTFPPPIAFDDDGKEINWTKYKVPSNIDIRPQSARSEDSVDREYRDFMSDENLKDFLKKEKEKTEIGSSSSSSSSSSVINPFDRINTPRANNPFESSTSDTSSSHPQEELLKRQRQMEAVKEKTKEIDEFLDEAERKYPGKSALYTKMAQNEAMKHLVMEQLKERMGGLPVEERKRQIRNEFSGEAQDQLLDHFGFQSSSSSSTPRPYIMESDDGSSTGRSDNSERKYAEQFGQTEDYLTSKYGAQMRAKGITPRSSGDDPFGVVRDLKDATPSEAADYLLKREEIFAPKTKDELLESLSGQSFQYKSNQTKKDINQAIGEEKARLEEIQKMKARLAPSKNQSTRESLSTKGSFKPGDGTRQEAIRNLAEQQQGEVHNQLHPSGVSQQSYYHSLESLREKMKNKAEMNKTRDKLRDEELGRVKQEIGTFGATLKPTEEYLKKYSAADVFQQKKIDDAEKALVAKRKQLALNDPPVFGETKLGDTIAEEGKPSLHFLQHHSMYQYLEQQKKDKAAVEARDKDVLPEGAEFNADGTINYIPSAYSYGGLGYDDDK